MRGKKRREQVSGPQIIHLGGVEERHMKHKYTVQQGQINQQQKTH